MCFEKSTYIRQVIVELKRKRLRIYYSNWYSRCQVGIGRTKRSLPYVYVDIEKMISYQDTQRQAIVQEILKHIRIVPTHPLRDDKHRRYPIPRNPARNRCNHRDP